MKKIRSVLIANRGEIAIRIAKTLADMGIKTFGIYPDDDVSSAHLSYMEKKLALSGFGSRAYLSIHEIIKLSLDNKIDAVHPGYGFLSESEEFSHQCEKNSIIFLGPNKVTLSLSSRLTL